MTVFEILPQADWVPLIPLNSLDLDSVTKSEAIFLDFSQEDICLVAVSLNAAPDSSSELTFHLTFLTLRAGMVLFLLLYMLISLVVFESVTG